MGNTTKQDLVQRTSLHTGTSQAKVRRVVDEFLRMVGEELQSGETIELRGFGTFHSRRRMPRPARNPRTGDVVPLAERTVPLFKFSGDLRLGETSAPVWELAEAAS